MQAGGAGSALAIGHGFSMGRQAGCLGHGVDATSAVRGRETKDWAGYPGLVSAALGRRKGRAAGCLGFGVDATTLAVRGREAKERAGCLGLGVDATSAVRGRTGQAETERLQKVACRLQAGSEHDGKNEEGRDSQNRTEGPETGQKQQQQHHHRKTAEACIAGRGQSGAKKYHRRDSRG